MPDDTLRVLRCLVKGAKIPMKVSLSVDDDVDDLKAMVHNMGKNHILRDADISDLFIWKLNKQESLVPEESLGDRVFSQGDLSTIAVKLESSARIGDIFKYQPKLGLHIVVQLVPSQHLSIGRHRVNNFTVTISPTSSTGERSLSAARKRNLDDIGSHEERGKRHKAAQSIPIARTGSRPPTIQECWTPRSTTVKLLYEMLTSVRLVQVRGTPGSGKTTLMDLLHAHILSQDPQAIVEVIKGWPKSPEKSSIEERMQSRITTFPCASSHNYLLFDNAQDTYWDGLFWENFLKDTVQRGIGPFVILFCSYGSPTTRPVDYDHGNPLYLDNNARISLTPYTSSELEPSRPGLLFSRAEFEEAVDRFRGLDQDFIRVDQDLRQGLFDWTMGHAGAVGDLLNKLSHMERKLLRDGGILTIDHLHNVQQAEQLFSGLPNFSRGLPDDEELQKIGIAQVFRKLLSQGGSMIASGEVDEEYCHRHGWMHSERRSGITCFSFSSPLHAMYISSKLIPAPAPADCLFDTIQDMVFAIIKKFNPSQLSSPSRMGVAFSDHPLEACYQFEFYHGLFKATRGGVCICPELLTASGAHKGRIDFFVPGKKWGIELTREGNELFERSDRFSPGSKYGVWLSSAEMVDYILLDCRTKTPKLPHPGLGNLFHAVFEDQFRRVTILNNKLETVEGPISLLED